MDIKTGNDPQDFGMWERGDKTNKGIPEINVSSIGMAKVIFRFLLVSHVKQVSNNDLLVIK